MSSYYQRGIHKASLIKSMRTGTLRNLLDIVRTNKDYVVLLRDDRFNVYYRGGNVAKVKSDKSVDFDKQYFRQHQDKAKEDYDLINEHIAFTKALFKDGRYNEYMAKVIPAMNHYFELELKGDEEKESQHQLCISNTYGSSSEFTILDLEYGVSEISKFAYCGERRCGKNHDSIPRPRFDIVTVRKSDGKICIMELKKGTKALEGKSGLGEHAESFESTVGHSKEKEKLFVEEMRYVLEQMKSLDLIDERVSINSDEVEYMVVFQENRKETETPNQVKVFRDKMKEEFRKYKITKQYQTIELHDGDYSLRNNHL